MKIFITNYNAMDFKTFLKSVFLTAAFSLGLSFSNEAIGQYVPVPDAQTIVFDHFNSIDIDNQSSPTIDWDTTRFKYFEVLRDRLSNAQNVEETLNGLDADLVNGSHLPANDVDLLRSEADDLLTL